MLMIVLCRVSMCAMACSFLCYGVCVYRWHISAVLGEVQLNRF